MFDALKGFISFFVGAIAIPFASWGAPYEASIRVTDQNIGQSNLVLGYTFTQCTFRASQEQCGRSTVDPLAVEAAKRAEKELGPHIANLQIYGWGSPNPLPAPGEYNLGPLYKRLDIARSAGAQIMITFCCSPDWMSGGPIGGAYTRYWTRFPNREHWSSYAKLARKIAADNPDVKYFQVWNEFKGLWLSSSKQWDYVTYTDFYNLIYDAVKEVRPDALIGGPYVVVSAWRPSRVPVRSGVRAGALEVNGRPLDAIRYWLKNKSGADFIALDAANKERGSKPSSSVGGVSAYDRCEIFPAAVKWMRGLDEEDYPGARKLPIVWSEWYSYPDAPQDAIATVSACLIKTIRSGASAVLIWGPEGLGSGDQSFPLALWTGTTKGGGKPSELLRVMREFAIRFHPGVGLRAVVCDGPVTALASAQSLAIVNTAPGELMLLMDGRTVRLKRGEIRFMERNG
jgi:hypothetical protein